MKSGNIVFSLLGTIIKVAILVLAVYYIYIGAGNCYSYGYRVFAEPAVSSGEGRTVTVTVTEKMSPKEIGELFENKGLVRDGRLFMLQYYFSEYYKTVKPGEFELSTAMTAEEMMKVMSTTQESDEEDSKE